MLTIVEIIRDLRAAGLKQADIVRRTQIPQSRLSRWEGGRVPAGADDALRLKLLHSETVVADAPQVPTEEARDAA